MTHRIQIAGAGIGGLSVGVAFSELGWDTTIHERASKIREPGAGLLLKPNSVQVLRTIKVFDALERKPAEVRAHVFFDSHGRQMSIYRHGGKLTMYCPRRQEVVDALYSVLTANGGTVRTSSRIARARADGVLIDVNDEEYRGDIVVAADGWQSQCRDSLGLGKIAEDLPHGDVRVIIPRGEGDPADVYHEYVSTAVRVGMTPVASDQTYVYISCSADNVRGRTVPVDVDYLRACIPGLHPNFLERLGAAKEADWHTFNHVKVDEWYRGRAVIVGDAANALPPTLAQGAGLAVMNGTGLARIVSQTNDLDHAICSWQTRYKPLTDHTVRWSMRYLQVSRSEARGMRRLLMVSGRVPGFNAYVRRADRRVVGANGPLRMASV